MSSFTSFSTVSNTASDPTGLPLLSRQPQANASSISLTNSTSISNADSSAPSFPFNHTKDATTRPSIASIIFPVVVGLICVFGLAGMCFFVRRKRQQGKQGWWSKKKEDYIGYELPRDYELGTRRVGQDAHRFENWGDQVAQRNKIQIIITRELEGADDKQLELQLAAAETIETRDGVRKGKVWAASGGEENGERTAILEPELGEIMEEAHNVGDTNQIGRGEATEGLDEDKLEDLVGAFTPTQRAIPLLQRPNTHEKIVYG